MGEDVEMAKYSPDTPEEAQKVARRKHPTTGFTVPLLTALLGCVFLRERLTAPLFAGAIVSFTESA
jgi:hypothetical protein